MPIIDSGKAGIGEEVGTSSLRTVYGEAIAAGTGNLTISYNGHEATGAPVTTSVSIASLPPGDPSAEIPVGSTTSDPYSTVCLNIPAMLAAGTAVTLSIDPSVEPDITVYQGTPGALGSSIILGGTGGITSHTWTVGTDLLPPAVDVIATNAASFTTNFFQIIIAAEADTQPAANKDAKAATPAIAPIKGHLVAFDGTMDDKDNLKGGDPTVIQNFEEQYDDARPVVNGVGGPTYERGTATPQLLAQSDSVFGKGVNSALKYMDLLSTKEGFREMLARVVDALQQVQAFYNVPANDAIPLDIIGYSRGAIEADVFMHALVDSKLVTFSNGKNFAQLCKVRFVGLIAPVASIHGDIKTLMARVFEVAPSHFPGPYQSGYLALADDKHLTPTAGLYQWDTLLPADDIDKNVPNEGHVEAGHDHKVVQPDLFAAAAAAHVAFKPK
jgi:hypothetical protein